MPQVPATRPAIFLPPAGQTQTPQAVPASRALVSASPAETPPTVRGWLTSASASGSGRRAPGACRTDRSTAVIGCDHGEPVGAIRRDDPNPTNRQSVPGVCGPRAGRLQAWRLRRSVGRAPVGSARSGCAGRSSPRTEGRAGLRLRAVPPAQDVRPAAALANLLAKPAVLGRDAASEQHRQMPPHTVGCALTPGGSCQRATTSRQPSPSPARCPPTVPGRVCWSHGRHWSR
jgi:hypothetical protein